MIGYLPNTLVLEGQEFKIRTDYRVALNILCAYSDPELTPYEKAEVLLECLYEDNIKSLPDIEKAVKEAVWFLNGGNYDEAQDGAKIMDWEQDEQMIFSAINKVAGKEVRQEEYIHWWTFLGYFREIGEGLFTTVVDIRRKRASGKKLEKYEKEFYEKNVDIVKLKPKYTEKEKQKIEELKKKLRGG